MEPKPMENEEERKDVSETKTYLCDLCFYKKQNVKALFECSACCQLLCEECDAFMHKNPMLRSHIRTKPGAILEKFGRNEREEFKNSFNKRDCAFMTFRSAKCEELFKELNLGTKKNVRLIKCIPGSGKTFFAQLFMYYIKKMKNVGNNQVAYATLPINEEDLEAKIKKQIGFNSSELTDYNGDKDLYVILDETQHLYTGYDQFWGHVKTIGDSNSKVKFLCFAAYASVRSIEMRTFGTPLCFKENNTNGFEILKFTKEEFKELLLSYEEDSHSNEIFTFDNEMEKYIYEETRGHPEIVATTIDFIFDNMKNLPEANKNFQSLRRVLGSNEYYAEIKSTKACPSIMKDIIGKAQLIELIKEVHLYNECVIGSLEAKCTNAEELEKLGVLCQDLDYGKVFKKYKFFFASKTIGSLLFNSLFKGACDAAVIKNPSTVPKIEIILQSLQRMEKNNFLNVANFKESHSLCKDKSLSEDQWCCEFFRCLKAILPDTYFIISQAGSEVGCNGELDLFVNGLLGLGIELTTRNNAVPEHLGRAFIGKYNLPKGSEYFVIEFREDGVFYPVHENYTDQRKFIDLRKYDIKKCLIRVLYAKDFSKVHVYYQEKPLAEYFLI